MTHVRHLQTLGVLLVGVVSSIMVEARAQDCQPSWSDQFPSSGVDGDSQAVAVFDDGSGPAIYVGGEFVTSGGLTVNHITRWNGTALSAVGGGFNGPVWALIAYDDGSGPALYAGGEFTEADGAPAAYVARWDGESWNQVGGGMDNAVYTFATFDDGAGNALYAGGRFTSLDGQPAGGVARWDGAAWIPVGAGVTNGSQEGHVRALAAGNTASGPVLFAGGSFDHADGIEVDNVAGWDGENWYSLNVEFSNGNGPAPIRALVYFDDGSGPALIVGGYFNEVNGSSADNIVRWDGEVWAEVGGGIDGIGVYELNVLQLSGKAELYVSGWFSIDYGAPADGVARWDGESWIPMNNANFGPHDLAVFDDGSGLAIYGAGGNSNDLGHYSGLIRWDGSTWSGIYSGVYNGVSGGIFAMTSFDDGEGQALYIGGYLQSAGSTPANHVARWDGEQWSALGEGVNDVVRAMAVYDDGGGLALYVGGDFTMAGRQPANRVAKWDGAQWHPLDAGMNNQVMVLHVHSDVNGPSLYAGGRFTMAGNTEASKIARWDGSTWWPLGWGLSSSPPSLAGR